MRIVCIRCDVCGSVKSHCLCRLLVFAVQRSDVSAVSYSGLGLAGFMVEDDDTHREDSHLHRRRGCFRYDCDEAQPLFQAMRMVWRKASSPTLYFVKSVLEIS